MSNDSNDSMVNKFKPTVVHVTPKPGADLCMCEELPLDKELWKITTGPRGQSAAGKIRRFIARSHIWVSGSLFYVKLREPKERN